MPFNHNPLRRYPNPRMSRFHKSLAELKGMPTEYDKYAYARELDKSIYDERSAPRDPGLKLRLDKLGDLV